MFAIVLYRERAGKELTLPIVMSRKKEDLLALTHDYDFVRDTLLSYLQAGETADLFVVPIH